jgi:hypothetical protein
LKKLKKYSNLAFKVISKYYYSQIKNKITLNISVRKQILFIFFIIKNIFRKIFNYIQL